MTKEEKEKAAIEKFVWKLSGEGVAYALENYPPGKDCPKELRQAAQDAASAIEDFTMILEEYMEKYDIEYC